MLKIKLINSVESKIEFNKKDDGEIIRFILAAAKIDANHPDAKWNVTNKFDWIRDGGGKVYRICYQFEYLSNIRLVTKKLKNRYKPQIERLLEGVSHFLEAKDVHCDFKLHSIGFILSKLNVILQQHFTCGPNTQETAEKFMQIFWGIKAFALKNNQQKLVCQLSSSFEDFYVYLEDNLTRNQINTAFAKRIDQFRNELFEGFFKFKLIANNEGDDVDLKFDAITRLSHNNFIKIANSICSAILKLKECKGPFVGDDLSKIELFHYLKISWQFLISFLEHSNVAVHLSHQLGYLHIKDSIEYIQQSIDYQYTKLKTDITDKLQPRFNSCQAKLRAQILVLNLKEKVLAQVLYGVNDKIKQVSQEIEAKNILEQLNKSKQTLVLVENKIKSAQNNLDSTVTKMKDQQIQFARAKADLNREFASRKENLQKNLGKLEFTLNSLESKRLSINFDIKRIHIEINAIKSTPLECSNRIKVKREKSKELQDSLNRLTDELKALKVSNLEIKQRQSQEIIKNDTLKRSINIYAIETQKSLKSLEKRTLNAQETLRSSQADLLRLENCLVEEKGGLEENTIKLNEKFKQTQSENRLLTQNEREYKALMHQLEKVEGLMSSQSLSPSKKLSTQANCAFLESIRVSPYFFPLERFEKSLLGSFEQYSENIFAFLFGGRVRDGLLNKDSRDVDVVVFAPEGLMEIIFKLNKYYKSPHVDNLYQKRIEVDGKLRVVDVSIYSDDQFKAFKHKPDLKVNALMVDKNGRLYDLTGGVGYEELLKPEKHQSMITCVGNMYQRFTEDPFRVIRILSTASRINRCIPDHYWPVLTRSAPKVSALPLSKYLSIFDKLFKHQSVRSVLQCLFKHPQFMKGIFPFLDTVSDHQQAYLFTNIEHFNKKYFKGGEQEAFANNVYLAIFLSLLSNRLNTLGDINLKVSGILKLFWASIPNPKNEALKLSVDKHLHHYLRVYVPQYHTFTGVKNIKSAVTESGIAAHQHRNRKSHS